MLIKVFGVWLIASNVSFLNPKVESGCMINFVNANRESNYIHMTNHKCDDIAAEINKQMQR